MAPALFLTNTTWTTGRIGPGSLRFNGAPANGGGSRAWVSNTNYRVLPPSGQPFSVSLWFNPDALTTGWRGIVGNGANASTGWHVALHTPGVGTNFLVFAATGAGSSLNVTGRTLLLPGQWHQLALTYDGSAGNLYLDNALLARGSGNLLTHDGPIYFGGGVGSFDGFLGSMDDLRTYTNLLTHEQISLNGHWRFDETTGGFCADGNIQGHHAIVTDAAARVPGRDGSAIELGNSQVIVRNDDYGVLPPSGGAFSVGFWLRPQFLTTGRSGLMSCGDGTNRGWQLAVNVAATGQTKLHLVSTNVGGTLDLWAPVALTNGAWTRVDITYNGGIATVFANGRLAGSNNGAIRGSRSPLVIGAAPGTANFRGTIDDLKIYGRERAAAEIGPVAATMWETVFLNSTTNLALQGSGPPGKTLYYSIVSNLTPTLGALLHSAGSPVVTYQAGGQRGADIFAYTVSDGEFTSEPAIVTLSVVKPHWLSPNGGSMTPRDGSSPERAWAAGTADALDAIWRTNNSYDCFFYSPGEFQTRGWKYQERTTANAGCKHLGSGSTGTNRTTLKLVDIWGPYSEGVFFAGGPSDGFEVHHMVLDCNADAVPKYAIGEPVWLRVPLVTTTRVDAVTLRWNEAYLAGARRTGRAAVFDLCTRLFATNTYNCTALTSTGQVDVLPIGVAADELLLQLNRREVGVDFYGLSEIEVAGNAISLPSATILGGGESRLDAQHNFYSAVDGDTGTWWASGPESQVQITLPFAAGTTIRQLNLRWNCKIIPGTGRLGAAASYLIRARDESTGQFYDVPFTRQPRTASGWETNTFATIVTDQLMLFLTSKDSLVDYYSLKEVSLQNGSAGVNLRLPTVLSYLGWGGVSYRVLRAFDRDHATQWASDTQGMVGAMDLLGSNLKFTHLKIIGFGTKAGRECFPMFFLASGAGAPRHLGNVLIEDCILTEPATNNTDGVSAVFLAANPPNTLTNAVIRRCTVTGMRSRFGYSHAFSAAHVEDSLVEDCGVAVYFEPDSDAADDLGHIFIRSNRFINVNYGLDVVSHPGAEFDAITFLDNEIILNGTGGWGFRACDVCSAGPSGSMTNFTALNNIIRYADWLPRPANADGGLSYTDMRHALFGNNVVALGTANSLRVRQCPAGVILPPDPVEDCTYPDPGPPGPTTYPPCVDVLLPGYRRAWFNNCNLSGTLLPVRFSANGVDGLAAQQQWTE